jgi:glutamine amidotransferase
MLPGAVPRSRRALSTAGHKPPAQRCAGGFVDGANADIIDGPEAPMIAIVDYRAGNLASVARALEFLGHSCEVTDRAERIRAADRVILPGVGAAGATMENLRALGLVEVLRQDVAAAGKPFLGICIGIQVLMDSSEEDRASCLGIIPGRVERYPSTLDGRPLKVPQIGWNRVHQLRPHPIFLGVPDDTHFYFVNSYYPVPDDPRVALAQCEYGVRFTAAIARSKVIATQFHLEKSGAAGLKMLDNFCRMAA